PLHLQSKLLGALDEKKIKRIGGQTLRPVEARIIAATNVDLDQAIESRIFRKDLYYRLGVLHIHLPPLREHLDDIPQLCRSFLSEIAPNLSLFLDADELETLMNYAWPGNVRELRNVIERTVILRDDDRLRPSQLLQRPTGITANPTSPADGRPREPSASGREAIVPLKEIEKEHIRSALSAYHHNHTQSARALGISRSTLMRKIKTYRLDSCNGNHTQPDAGSK
ncbi:MAG TPA: sigma 54-interacting transcriptional regulator, partial [Desulfobacterales bacterium]